MMRTCLYWILFATLASASTVAYAYRLPTSVIPEHYKLQILTYLPEPGNFNYSGKVWIRTNCVSPTQNITLHSKKLAINDKRVTVKDISGAEPTTVKVSKIEEIKDDDFLVIHLDQKLKQDHKYEIFIEFEGELQDGLAGFYRSSYTNKDTKEKHWLGVTQFEAISARKAFPCFDEPGIKATFEIILGRNKQYSSISNMPLEKTEAIKEKDGWFWDHYENSVPMSTYLVAFIVSDFGYKVSEPSTQNNVTFKIWARKNALNQVDFARNIGPKALDFYEKFFDIKYPLPKQDMVAIPDFSAGAMENWGLITYRESYLLFDPQESSTTSQHSVASVISHELAHQWFGNLVTMKWWTDLWLNEGFATYMAGLAVDHLFPHWNSLQEEAVNNLLNVFSFDALRTSHPVSVPIGHPNEIDEIFDTISYKKGSFLIRMMSLFLGEETLRKGVSNYLKKHEYSNAEQDDLWASLTDVAHKNKILPQNLTVKTIMDSWTVQTGYPVITVTRDYAGKTAELKQQRFLKDAIAERSEEPCWWIPLTYTDKSELNFNSTRPRQWLSCPSEDQVLYDLPDDKTWILFNIQVAGIYKINYDLKNWKLLSDTLRSPSQFKQIPTLNRVQLIDDASDLSWTGDLDYKVLFDLLRYLEHEEEYLPWKAALSNINAIKRQLKKSSVYGNFKKYMQKLLTPIYEKVGGLTLKTDKTEKLDAIKHQVLIVTWACRFEVANCVEATKKLLNDWIEAPNKGNSVPKDLRSVVYCTGIKHGGEKEWNFIWDQYKKSNVATEKNTILNSLGCTRELWLLSRYLDWSLDESTGIRRQDVTTVFSAVAGNDVGYYVAKSFLMNKIDKIHAHLSVNSKRLSRYLAAVATQITSEQDQDELEHFVKEKREYLKEIKKGVEQSLETVKLNVQWQKKHFDAVSNLLRTAVQ